MVCTAISRLFGFIKQALISYYFGATGYADALNAVFNIPNNLRKLFAEGAFSSAFIPVLSSAIVADASGERPRALVRNLVAFQILLLVPLIGLGLAFPRSFMDLINPFSDPAKLPVAAQLFRWMFNYILFVSLSALAMAVLNSHGSFTIPALSPLLFSLAIVLSIVFLNRRLGVFSMGVGVLAGGVLQLVFPLPALRRKGYDFRPDFRFSNPDFVRTAKLWVPYLVSASIVTINQMVAQFFASGLEDGSVSAVANSVMFLQIPIGVFTASISTVLFPAMSRQAASGDREGLRGSMTYGMEFLVVLLVPSAILLFLFGREVISAALQRGRFTPESTLMASKVLAGYAVGLLSIGLYNFLQRVYYSQKVFRAPLLTAAFIAVIDILLSLVMKETRLRVSGLAYANSIAFTAGFILLAALARRRVGRFGAARLAATFGKSLLASAPMAVGLLAFVKWKPSLWTHGGSLKAVAWIAAVVVASAALTVAMYALLKVPLFSEIWRGGSNARGTAPGSNARGTAPGSNARGTAPGRKR
jgi:putative peptidoglycan lipid II flippase